MFFLHQGCWPAQYNTDSLRVPKESPLDHNHSHHILVDNGTQHQFGVEINFRTKLENAISKMKTDTGMGEGMYHTYILNDSPVLVQFYEVIRHIIFYSMTLIKASSPQNL